MSRRTAVDLGTPATRARLEASPCPWQHWPDYLKHAALAIDVATRLVAGRCLCRASDVEHVGRPAKAEWSPQQRAIVADYRGWQAQMTALGWDHQRVVDVIVHGGEPGDPYMLRLALNLYARGHTLL